MSNEKSTSADSEFSSLSASSPSGLDEPKVSSISADVRDESSDPAEVGFAQLLQFEKEVAKAFGKDLIESEINYGDLCIRLTKSGYEKAAKICKEVLDLEYLSYISGIDWMPMPDEGGNGAADASRPTQPNEMTFGVAGSMGRFQVFAHVQSPNTHLGLTIKVDIDEKEMSISSWTDIYPGANWHERECWEMYGIDFVGHPEIRHLYLPGEFEGFPLRKDFPLLARVVKPWPGIVDVEPMLVDEADTSSNDGDSDD